jgi:hypothetical protein
VSAPHPSPPAAERWVALPSPRRPRFVLPAATGRQAYRGLAVYHPVTRRALVGWCVARVLARLGMFRLLPSVAAPVDLDTVQAWFPSALVAVAFSQRATRHAGLVLDADAHLLGFVKVARDPAGAASLEREVALLRELGPHLSPPVRAPNHLRAAPGIISFDTSPWAPRLRPWDLDPEVAAAVGAFYRRGGGDEQRGPAHGDFAPWNLLRLVGGGWLLVDWEDATADGRPFQDPFHWLVQSHALLGRPSRRALVAGVRGTGRIGRALDAYAAAAGLERVDREAAFRTYLERTASLRSAESRHDREVTARLALLQAMAGPGHDAQPGSRA